MSTEEATNLKEFLPQGLTLYPFQIETIHKTVSFLEATDSHSAYVANEMGLGKSITSIITANLLRAKKVIVVCPAIMRLVWEEEIEKWAISQTGHGIKIATVFSNKDLPRITNASWVICSYNLTLKEEALRALSSHRFDLVIFDEAHYMKNLKAKRTKACLGQLFNKANYRLFLSGTPITRNVVDAFSIFNKVLPSTFPNYYKFAYHYSYVKVTPFGTSFYGLKNAEELSQIIRQNFYIRYRKEDVLTELPDKTYQKILLPHTYAREEKALETKAKLLSEREKTLKAIEEGSSFLIPPTLAEHRRLQGEIKVPAIVEFAKELLDEELPIVIFAHHKNVIAKLAEALSEFNPVVITGETNPKDRMDAVKAFQEGKTNVFIGNFQAAGIGITLTRSSHVLLAELDYIPTTINQAIDRLHRIGQKNQVTVYWFSVKNSLDTAIDLIIMKRVSEFKKVFDAS